MSTIRGELVTETFNYGGRQVTVYVPPISEHAANCATPILVHRALSLQQARRRYLPVLPCWRHYAGDRRSHRPSGSALCLIMPVIEAQCLRSWSLTITGISAVSGHSARYLLRICSLRMSACPQCWASSRSTWRYTQRSGSGPRQ